MPDAPKNPKPITQKKLYLLAREARRGRCKPSPGKPATCGARTRRGTSCMCLAMPNGRCRLHGGMSTGPRTPEGRQRVRDGHARYIAAKRAAAASGAAEGA